ncbi:MAG: hypothetical protein DRQ39_00305 [Gammaproteobacteria bacterium]|nr:MAG: hypothetical protein DRQ39_00305 [Gammaproteobacteria bacterium]RKZ95865.1 MAG: hypothetical protein DRQ40_02635 [Gammaproteobacteria bacterium]RLA01927.1 MAG: hypothetical protein DRQ42_01995 [Gammaproteobacteria bacterium]
MEHQQHNFKTALDLQKKLAIKREALGYQEFFRRVDTILSPTLKSENVVNKTQFGRRYEDDIYWSIQIRYPDITMCDIRKIANILCV